ncbi:protein of unknown function [Ruminococcaceae bacterium BL-6]|nr:protein of unknown function [Ruminococcaceae bacterium BL-6]
MEDYLLQIGDDLYTIDEKAKVTDQKNEYKLAIRSCIHKRRYDKMSI